MSTPIGLGLPEAPLPTLAPRRKTRQLKVGSVGVGSDSPISVQSMTTTKTHDINATLQQIAQLTASGCDIVRVACPKTIDAEALPQIAKKSPIPVIADIHFQPKYVYAAIQAGCGAVRVNPGNIRKFDDQVKEIAQMASDHGVSLRIGVNAGSLDKRLLEKYGKATPEALVESAVWEASLFEEHGFRDFKISVKHNDPVVMVEAYRQLAERGDWPLHLGVTEAGPAFQGTIKSSVAFGTLLSQGIGDTIRVSLSAPPVEEVKVGTKILESLNLGVAASNSARNQTLNTPAIATLLLLEDQIGWLLDLGGIDAAEERCRRMSDHLYGWADASSYATPFVTDPTHRSPVVATIDLAPGVDATRVIAELRGNGIVDVDPYRALKRNQLRIGTYASVDQADVEALTACIDHIVERL